MEFNVKRLIDVKRTVTHILKELPNTKLPAAITFDEGLESPVYKIMISVIEKDRFVDSNGNAWVKEKV